MGSAQSSNNKQNGVTTTPLMEKQQQQQQQNSQPINSSIPSTQQQSKMSEINFENTNEKSTPKESGGGSGGGCPMKLPDGSYQFNWKAMLQPSFPHNVGGSKPLTAEQVKKNVGTETSNNNNEITTAVVVSDKKNDIGGGGGGCPMKQNTTKKSSSGNVEYNVYSEPMDPTNNMPFNPNQLPASTQTVPLSTERVPSSIPKGGAAAENSTWTYPSPQMFYNALARKGKLQDTTEDEIDSVVALHNNMNEKTWKKVLEWENTIVNKPSNTSTSSSNFDLYDIGSKLLKFQGRPTDLSPKAAFKHYLLGHPLPYDRHDWTVERPDGTIQRYIIDYYHDESRASDQPSTAHPNKDDEEATPSLLVDVRPALDSPFAFLHRVVTMPFARHVRSSTSFQPLPMFPTSAMQTQVEESVDVWQSIQRNAAASKKSIKSTTQGEINTESESTSVGNSTTTIKYTEKDAKDITKLYTEKDAKDITKLFAVLNHDCRTVQKILDDCPVDDDTCSAQASMGLMICMGKVLCPLQNDALNQTLKIQNDSTGTDDTLIDVALSRVSDCVTHKTMEHQRMKEQYPKIVQ